MKKFLAVGLFLIVGCQAGEKSETESAHRRENVDAVQLTYCTVDKAKNFLETCENYLNKQGNLSKGEAIAIEKTFNLVNTSPQTVSDAQNSASTQCKNVKSRVETKTFTIDLESKLGRDADFGVMCDFIGTANIYWGNRLSTYKESAYTRDVKSDQNNVGNVNTTKDTNVNNAVTFDVMSEPFVTFCSIKKEGLKAGSKSYTFTGNVSKANSLLEQALSKASGYKAPEYNGLSNVKCANADAYFASKYHELSRGRYSLQKMCEEGALTNCP